MADITSNGTGGGDWNTEGTWIGGVVPIGEDAITIAATDTVTTDAPGCVCKSLVSAGIGAALELGAIQLWVHGAMTLDNLAVTTVAEGATISADEGISIGANGSLTLSHDFGIVIDAADQALELDGGTIDTGGNTLSLAGNLLGATGVVTELIIEHCGTGNVDWAAAAGRITSYTVKAGVTITRTGVVDTAAAFVEATGTINGDEELRITNPILNPFCDIQGSISEAGDLVIALNLVDRSNSGKLSVDGENDIRITSSTDRTLTQSGEIDMNGLPLKVGSLYVNDKYAKLVVTGLATDLGGVLLGFSAIRTGRIDTSGASGTVHLVSLAAVALAVGSQAVLGAAKHVMSGTFDGTSTDVTSEGAQFGGGGELTKVGNVPADGSLSGDIYAPITMDGGDNDVTAPNRVIFTPSGGVLGYERVGSILGRRR